ncbi:TRAP transporter small permease [Psychromarinibacter halotolerans]|uniref:TRAP transporter small permease protein n=2 Tax=Psychromarinibacter halotolerans TaxID=1775175 RepID=A0ABV7GVK2_9RHOB|nr:TRAP transporter small permease [Psychromarinibacter halotolerans]
MAAIACAILALTLVAIVYDVITRNLNMYGVTWVLAMTEYGLVYMTALGTPWLLRNRGHVSIEAIRRHLPEPALVWLERLVLVLCIFACLVAIAATITVIDRYWTNYDTRARFLRRWWLYAPILVCFVLCAIQFLRFLFSPGTFFTPADTEEGL